MCRMCIRNPLAFCCCCCGWKKAAVVVLSLALLVAGAQLWIKGKQFVFDAEEISAITIRALESSRGSGHDVTFSLVEKELRSRYGRHILLPSQTEWLFINAGGWMGAFYLLHASLSEYVLFFGTAVDTSGHSGRYWANISDTIVSGTFRQWKEGTTDFVMYTPGDLVLHNIGEAAAIQWTAGTWMVEYGRGVVPSTLVFALADNVFGTTDLYLMLKTLKVYGISVLQEILMGNT